MVVAVLAIFAFLSAGPLLIDASITCSLPVLQETADNYHSVQALDDGQVALKEPLFPGCTYGDGGTADAQLLRTLHRNLVAAIREDDEFPVSVQFAEFTLAIDPLSFASR
jgi:hypothetical protein